MYDLYVYVCVYIRMYSNIVVSHKYSNGKNTFVCVCVYIWMHSSLYADLFEYSKVFVSVCEYVRLHTRMHLSHLNTTINTTNRRRSACGSG